MFLREGIQREVRMRRFVAALLVLGLITVFATHEASATDWAKAMFDHTTHDFGMVPRGSEAKHYFTFENIYLEDAHIKSISSSCHCTDVEVTEPSLKTHEKSQIVATLNTRQFTGTKDATIRVVFDKPFPAEVQLHVHSYIRTDVVLEPGVVQFGQVTEGSTVTKTIDLRHAGNPDWRIAGIEKEDPHVDVKIKRVAADSSQSAYQLAFTLKSTAPPGYIRRPITLLTNDQNPNARRVIVPMEGVVAAPVTVRPSPVSFGLVQIGREVTRNVVVQGQKDFQVLELVGPDSRFSLGSPEKLNTPSKLHLLRVKFSAGTEPGKLEGNIQIRTDIGEGRVLRVGVSGEVIDPSEGSSDKASPSADTAPSEEAKSSDGWRSAKE